MSSGTLKSEHYDEATKSEEGYDYIFKPSACLKCSGLCCRRESGYVWVKKADILKISGYLKIESAKLIDEYLVKVGRRFSIKEIKYQEEFPCIFFDMTAKKCLIYQVRPSQCQTFPFWEEFMDKEDQSTPDYCPGVVLTG